MDHPFERDFEQEDIFENIIRDGDGEAGGSGDGEADGSGHDEVLMEFYMYICIEALV